jgi:hypothetical protein
LGTNKDTQEYISEGYRMNLKPNEEMNTSKYIIFKDVGKKEIQSNLYLIAKYYRYGLIKEEDNKKKKKEDQKNVRRFKRPHSVSIFDLNPTVISSLLSEDPVNASLTCYTSKQEEHFSKLHTGFFF